MTSGGDLLLKALSQTPGLICNYVSQFLNSKTDIELSELIDSWFLSRAQIYFDDPRYLEKPLADVDSLDFTLRHISPQKVKLLSIQSNYFRGFRKQEGPVSLQGDLVVLDGRNSSGKTSLAEAIEWLLTGHICRRDAGDPKELSECISNRFKPKDDETWVELVLSQGGEIHTIKRVLIKDYDTKKNSLCETKVTFDGEALEEQSPPIVDQIFAGVLPLLMQHTLRLFVLDSPEKRRDYFEQLLSLDRITHLIEKSVVSDARLDDFPSNSGSTMLAEWNGLKNAVSSKSIFRRVERANEVQMRDALHEVLVKIAIDEFTLDTNLSLDKLVESINLLQKLVRQKNFPLLEGLRPKRTLDEALLMQLSVGRYDTLLQSLAKAQSDYQIAQRSAQAISASQMAISKSLENLRDVGLIIDSDDQVCPLCNYQEIPTLSLGRVNEVTTWNPIRKAVSIAKQNYQQAIEEALRTIRELQSLRYDLVPRSFSNEEWSTVDTFLNDAIVIDLRTELESADLDLQEFDMVSKSFRAVNLSDDSEHNLHSGLEKIIALLPKIIEHARTYAGRFSDFENYIGVIASQDNLYTNRDLWLKVVERSEILLSDLQWEIAKKKAQQELSLIREKLISVRQKYLETRRLDFSTGISELWNKLRTDRYSPFNKLFIPEPRGRGFPVKIEVKALLDNNLETHEVDALGVFSESQINAVGIAAFITRSRLMGHSCLVFDDPVQSMDEEHFKTFAKEVLSYLCDEGFQVIVLTHSDTFAREISYAHSDRPNYVTMKIEHSKRKGCRVEEGNRRVAERLDRAVSFADEGDLKQAWVYVRMAIERLYTIVQIKHGPTDFKPSSWANHSAEAMWKEGIEDIIQRLAPSSAKRLHEILGMTAGGAHDKAPEGQTNLSNAVKDIRPLLNKLQVGG